MPKPNPNYPGILDAAKPLALRCVCGHWHTSTQTCYVHGCGCNDMEPDDGTLGVNDDSCLGPNTLPGCV